MSSIFLNHADVRNLLSGLGKSRPLDRTLMSGISFVAKSLNMRDNDLINGIWKGVPRSEVGVHVSKEAFFKLVDVVQKNDMAAMKNTQRLAMIAESLSWKPDALMNHLKKTTGHLGSNASLARPKLGAPMNLERLGILPSEKWRTLARMPKGINIAAGGTGSGKSTTMQVTVGELFGDYASGPVRLIVPDQGALRPLRVELDELHPAVKPVVLFSDELRDRSQFDFAVEAAKIAPVFITAWGDSAVTAYKRVVEKIGPEAKSLVNGVLWQTLVPQKCDQCGAFRPECQCKRKFTRFVVSECVTAAELEERIAMNLPSGLLLEVSQLVIEGKMRREDAERDFGSIFSDPACLIRSASLPKAGTATAQSNL
ncbi:hypothetical protein [Rhizobium sp. BK176]|uniref:hypothetical protein n=1 Tax=Rhizobium sp. BK176 TaxID=2587071 RepID=UPI002168C415|nr:hypothetical protein [Rhizobium sp. BK176]MCS4089973.1 hypothetical protein [Rhizobium sp. BK176]